MNEIKRPKTTSPELEKELDKIHSEFDQKDENIKQLAEKRMEPAKLLEVEPQTKLSQKEIAESKDIYLKPKRSISSREKFNERFRSEYEFAKEYVYFIFENKECPGDTTTIWTKPFPGMAAEEWEVPANKPIYAPRYLAEQITRKKYKQLKTENKVVEDNAIGQIYGNIVVEHEINRLTATPATKTRSIFMGAKSF